jgi:putative endonuclease
MTDFLKTVRPPTAVIVREGGLATDRQLCVQDAHVYITLMRDEKVPAVYILSNRRYGTLYVGVTSQLWLRVCDHKNGTFGGFTWKYGLHRLVWYEHHHSMPSAIRGEKRQKTWLRVWKLELIDAFNPDWHDLHQEIDANINLVDEFATRTERDG